MRRIDAKARDGTIALAAMMLVAACGMAPPDDAALHCGDGTLDAWEACDDGNATVGDGCSAACAMEAGPALADEVDDAPGASGTGFHDPQRAVNGVRGGGETMQSLDVYSVGLGSDDWLVLAFSGRRLVDGPGDDLVVFENAFHYGEGLTFVDAAIVELSTDGDAWVTFPHDYVADDEHVYSAHEEDWIGFAGVTPVLLNDEDGPTDPFDPAAGGDGFDLAELADTEEADRIRRQGAAYVRIVPAAARVNPDTNEPFPTDPVSDGPDIDGVAARYLVEAP